MKKIVWACALALPFLAGPVYANGSCTFGISITLFGGSDCCNPCASGCGPCGPAQAMPWYTYWPYDSYFQTPANPCFPYWPTMSPSAPPAAAAPATLPQVQPARYQAPTYQPVGYYPQQAPSYWYGR